MKKRAFIYILAFLVSTFMTSLSWSKGLDPSIRCKKCHEGIYLQWQSSRHSNAFTDPLFTRVYRKLLSLSPEDAELCEFCHAPASRIGVQLLSREDAKKEGVSCDFCHTVSKVQPEKELPRYMNTPGVKRGPVEKAENSYHKTEFSSLHLESTFCQGCHEFENRLGLKVLSTYSEWESSFYRGEGIHCQYCHLPQLFGDEQFLGKKSTKNSISDHGMRGGHSPSKLKNALKISGSFNLEGKVGIVDLDLLNDKSGHQIPTGIPTHRVVVAARVFDEKGGLVGEKEVNIEKVVGDAQGRPLESAEDIFLKGKKVLKDNRIGPKEKRRLKIAVPLSGVFNELSTSVSLFYEIPSPDPTLERVRINFNNITIPADKGKFPFMAIIIVLMIAIIALISYDIVVRKNNNRK